MAATVSALLGACSYYKKNPRPVRWTTWGSCTLGCEHAHRSKRTALRCLTRHKRACKKQGGYSDRFIIRGRAGLSKRYSVVSGPVGKYDPHYEEE